MLCLPRWREGDGTDKSPSPGCSGAPHSPYDLPLPAIREGPHHSQGLTRSTPHLPARGWRPNKAELAAEAPPRVAHILLPCKAGRRAPPLLSSYPTARSAPGCAPAPRTERAPSQNQVGAADGPRWFRVGGVGRG